MSHRLTTFFRQWWLVLLLGLPSSSVLATVYNCSTVQQIRDAMAAAVAGDEIVIAPGVYTASDVAVSGSSAHFYSTANGTASNPIIIRSQSAANPAMLSGSNTANLTVLRIKGNYWIIRDLRVSTAQKGIVLDASNHCQIINCEVFQTGSEAIHVRDGSDYTLIENCWVHDTGLNSPGFGEGIYIGSDRSVWTTYDPYVSHTTVRHCKIGPNVAAEAFDIKEGTSETIVEHCEIDATGISGENFADSFIDLKGIRTYVRYNTFNRNNATNLTHGIAAIFRDVALSCYEHAIHNNVFNMNISSGNIVQANMNTSDVYAWNNTRNPSGSNYNSRVIASCCPPWYSPPAICNAPSNLNTSNVGQNSVTFTWTAATGASNYSLRYRVVGAPLWTIVNNLTGTNYVQSGLSANTTYEWALRSGCGATQSGYVAGSSFTTTSGASCNVPTGLNVSNITSSSVTLSWNSVSGANDYDLRYRMAGAGTWTNVNDLTTTSYNLNGLNASTTYEWEIRADCGTTQSNYTAGSNFTTASGGNNTVVVYDDALTTGWNNHSYTGTYDFANTNPVQVGNYSIKATYGAWGGVNIKRSTDLNLSGFNNIRFWARGEGNYLIRLRLDTNLGFKDYEFTTSTSWQQITVPLSTLGNPSTVKGIVLQSRSSQAGRIVYYDQIEFSSNAGSMTTSVVPVWEEVTELRVFPNPVQQRQLQIEWRNNGPAELGELVWYDMTGRQLAREAITLDNVITIRQVTLPVKLAPGIYLLRIQGQTRQAQERVVVH